MNLEQLDAQIAELQAQRAKLLDAKNLQPSPCLKSGNREIVVIGGAGQLGRLFVTQFRQSGYVPHVVEKDDWQNSADLFASAALVLVAVPIHKTLEVIAQLPKLADDCVLADITSIKQKPVEAMLAVHDGPVVGLHPMFGPDANSFKAQTVIVSEGGQANGYSWFLKQLEAWGAQLRFTDAAEHDRAMAMIQVLRHFSTIAYGNHLMHESVDLAEITELSSPIYRLELAMVGRLFAQQPELYTEIIFSNKENLDMMRRYIQRFESLLDTVAADDKKAFQASFAEISAWFGDYAAQFLHESSEMLAYQRRLK